MIAVRIPKDIREYKEKLVFGLNIRQIISIILALSICVPLYIFGKDMYGEETVSWLVIIVAVPITMFGFFKSHGMTFEQYIYALILQEIVNPHKRKFVTKNFFNEMENEADKENLSKRKNKKEQAEVTNQSIERAYIILQAIEDDIDLNIKERKIFDNFYEKVEINARIEQEISTINQKQMKDTKQADFDYSLIKYTHGE